MLLSSRTNVSGTVVLIFVANDEESDAGGAVVVLLPLLSLAVEPLPLPLELSPLEPLPVESLPVEPLPVEPPLPVESLPVELSPPELLLLVGAATAGKPCAPLALEVRDV